MKPNETEGAGKTPEELVRYLDLELANLRARKKSADPRNRAAILMAAILFIFMGAGVAIAILLQKANERRQEEKGAHVTNSAQQR